MRAHSQWLFALFSVVLLASCGQVTQRRYVHYGEVGYARLPAEATQKRRAAVHTSGVSWRHGDLEAARAEARSVGRPLLVYIYTTWCGPCKRLKKSTFPDPGVVKLLNARLVSLQLDGESEIGRGFVKRYRISSYPTMMFFRPDGVEIDRTFGYQVPAQFIRVVKDMLADRNTVSDMRRQIAKRPEAVELRYKIGLQLALRGDTDEAIGHLNKAVSLDPQDKSTLASQSLYVLGRYVHQMKTRDLKAAAAAYEQLLERYPRANAARPAAVQAAGVYARLKDKPKAQAVLQRLVKGAPKDSQRLLDAARATGRLQLDMKKGEKWARQVTKLRTDGQGWAALAELLQKQGKKKKALGAWKKALEKSPGNRRYLQAFSRLQGAAPK